MLGLIARPFAGTVGSNNSAFQASFPASNFLNNDYGRVGRYSVAAAGNFIAEIDLGAGPPTVDAVAVLWHNLGPADTIRVFANNIGDFTTTYDSGALAATTGTSRRDVAAPGKFLLTLATPQTLRYWYLQIVIAAGSPVITTGYAQFSRFFAGKSFIFQIGPQRAELSGFDMNQKIQLETGEERTSEDSLLIRPVAQLDFSYAKESELRDLFGQYTLGLGNSKPMLICPDITNATGLQDQIVFGRPENIMTVQSDTYDVWKFQARVRSFGP